MVKLAPHSRVQQVIQVIQVIQFIQVVNSETEIKSVIKQRMMEMRRNQSFLE